MHDKQITSTSFADAINCGLDFEEAMRSSDYVKLSSSPQVNMHKFSLHPLYHVGHHIQTCITLKMQYSVLSFPLKPCLRAQLGQALSMSLMSCSRSILQVLCSGPQELPIPFVQVIIQLRKFAQAAKRIKAAVGTEASAPQLAKAVTKGDIKPGDLSDIIGTEIRDGMDTSAFGEHAATCWKCR